MYNPTTGFIFIFNLIVGAGALTIPQAFSQVGLILGSLAILLLAMTSYITATFVVETIAGVNALKGISKDHKLSVLNEEHVESAPLLDEEGVHLEYTVSKKVELAQMANKLFSKSGLVLFYACVVVYLYGDLAIYAVAVPKSLREMTCSRPKDLPKDVQSWPCFGTWKSNDVYRLYVVLFALCMVPFAFGNVQKTKCIQIVTTVMRHLSFGLMIVIAALGIAHGQGQSAANVIQNENPLNLPNFFGVCIYSFMCHHSLPGLIAPIRPKHAINKVLLASFMVVLIAYLVLCYSAVFRYTSDEIEDVYTLNFKNYSVRSVGYFLGLFPVFTLSANFPVISITLRENLKTLSKFLKPSKTSKLNGKKVKHDSSLYALAAIVPPILIALITEDVSMLVGFTGAYAGLGIQWFIPACLALSLRRQLGESHSNPFQTTFKSNLWIYGTLTLAAIAMVLVTTTKFL